MKKNTKLVRINPPKGSESPDYLKKTSHGLAVSETNPSPGSKWHDKCIIQSEAEKKKKVKKKTKKNHQDEIIKFLEGCQTAPELNPNDGKYSKEVRFLEHKYIQCNISKISNEVEMTLPEEVKPLLINVTFLLHELKQRQINQELWDSISKIATLLTELTRRPIKKFDESDSPRPFDQIADKLAGILKEHRGPQDRKYEKLENEIKELQKELVQKDMEIKYVKEQILEERARLLSDSGTLDDCLRNSILKNQSLKAEIKYNKAQFRKYSKIMARKEDEMQKSLMVLNNLRKKLAKLESNGDHSPKSTSLKFQNQESDVCDGGSVTKYIKSRVVRDKKMVKMAGRSTLTEPKINKSNNQGKLHIDFT